MNLDTIALQIFIAVAEMGSFTKAAKRVGRTQSAVSQQILKLETLLNTSLIERGNGFALTQQGEIFLRYARQIFALHHEVFDHLSAPSLEGEVRFGLPEDFASVFLSDILVEFSRLHPRVMLNVECDLTFNLFQRFKQREFDLVLVKMNKPDDFPNGQDVWTEKLEWVGYDHLVDVQKPIPLVLSPEPCVYRASALDTLKKAKKEWRIVFSSSSYASTLAAVEAGMGLTVLPQTMIPDNISVLNNKLLPPLEDLHVSLLKHRGDDYLINSFENYALQKLK